MLSRREQMEFAAYVRRYPIDDESNFHVPAAQLAAIYVNAHRDKAVQLDPYRVDDFLIFMPDPVEKIDDEMDRNIARFFMRHT